jgi:endoglucanase Acf2
VTSPSMNTDDADSLVGEELVTTDNEGESTTADEREFLVSNDNRKQQQKISTARTTSSSRGTCASYPILVFLLLAGGMSVLIFLLIPPQPLKVPPQTQKFNMPFPQVDRAEFDDPINGFIDMDLFHSSLITVSDDDNAAASVAGYGGGGGGGGSSSQSMSFSNPFPTGAFWTNLVVRAPQGDSMSYPIAVYPFAYRWSSSSLRVSYPSGNRVIESHKISDPFTPELTLTTKEEIIRRQVVEYDPLSVTLRFVSSPNSKWKTTLIQGSPYVTISYTKSTPILKPLSIFSDVQCPGDGDNEDISDITNEKNGDRRRLDGFGVCSIDVRRGKNNIFIPTCIS